MALVAVQSRGVARPIAWASASTIPSVFATQLSQRTIIGSDLDIWMPELRVYGKVFGIESDVCATREV